MKHIIILLCMPFLLMACKANKYRHDSKVTEVGRLNVSVVKTVPSVIVYKTKADYIANIPVLMNKDKTEIISYPDIRDVCPGGNCSYPTPVEHGYLMDNRGISADVAFLSYTYAEYMQLERTPSRRDLMEKIIDKEPLTEFYNLGPVTSFNDPEAQVNQLILSGKLGEYTNQAE